MQMSEAHVYALHPSAATASPSTSSDVMHAAPVTHARLALAAQACERDVIAAAAAAGPAAARAPFPVLSCSSAFVASMLASEAFAPLRSRRVQPDTRAAAIAHATENICKLSAQAGIAAASGGDGQPSQPSMQLKQPPPMPSSNPWQQPQQPPAVAALSRPRFSPPPPSPTVAASTAASSARAAAAPAFHSNAELSPADIAAANAAARTSRSLVDDGMRAQPATAAASSSGFDRSRDMHDRENTLRQAASSGFAPKRPGLPERDEQRQREQQPSGARSFGWERKDIYDDEEDGGGRYKRQRSSASPPPAPPRPRSSSPTTDPTAGLGPNPFVSGSDKLIQDQIKKHGSRAAAEAAIRREREAAAAANACAPTKSLGMPKRKTGFVPPYKKNEETPNATASGALNPMLAAALAGPGGKPGETHPQLQGLDPKLVEMITCEMMESPGITWDEIAGLSFAKQSVREIVVWPILNPALFTGLRGPPKGLLLFGPPGTGKTLIGKAIASESGSKFFSISASSLTSKWHGEGEKLVRTLFAVAKVYQPSIIFIDEIDSLLSQRNESEFEASRRIKTEFLVQLDGASTTGKERVLLVGATNRPQELDEAARRRLVKKLYIPLPDEESRAQLLRHTMAREGVVHSLSEADMSWIVTRASGYSGSDMAALCTEASMGPIRALSRSMDHRDDITHMQANAVRPIEKEDFEAAFQSIRPSVNQKDLAQYIASENIRKHRGGGPRWNKQFGSFAMPEPGEAAAPLAADSAASVSEMKE